MDFLRDIGYQINEAIAELVDGAVARGASRAVLRVAWFGRRSFISLTDDGSAFRLADLDAVLPIGVSDTDVEPADGSVPEFGLRLIAASLSQCSRLIVATKQSDGGLSARTLSASLSASRSACSIDDELSPDDATLVADLERRSSGTIVVWAQVGRIVDEIDIEDEGAAPEFKRIANSLRAHLGLTYHRLLEGPRPAIRIYINGEDEADRIQPIDPFERSEPATQHLTEARRGTRAGMVVTQGYVLSHRDRRETAAPDSELPPRAAALRQGFYVYRAHRLVVAGSWLGLGNPEPWMEDQQHRLARIRVDVPDTADQAWRIDMRRHEAHPPPALRDWLTRNGARARRAARDVFVHRGAHLSSLVRAETESVWLVDAVAPLTYRVNRAHPMIADLLDASEDQRSLVEQALQVIEATIPIHRIWLDVADDPESPAPIGQRLPASQIAVLIERLVRRLLAGREITRAAALRRLSRVEPFDLYLSEADDNNA